MSTVQSSSSVASNLGGAASSDRRRRRIVAKGPSLRSFLADAAGGDVQQHENLGPIQSSPLPECGSDPRDVQARSTVYLESYGCQMNESDSEIVLSILNAAGYDRVSTPDMASVCVVNTCAIREGAEAKIWGRLGALGTVRRHEDGKRPTIAVLGCMAERLKTRLLEGAAGSVVDVVAGPDSYRDLPRLLQLVRGGSADAAVNVQLSQDETYADIAPVRTGGNGVSAFVSVMRGCGNLCSFCVVPFTRGVERSRDVATIVAEVESLARAGYREVTLLGQNVNSYHDAGTPASGTYADRGYVAAAGFTNMYRTRGGGGVRFAELLSLVAAAAPGVRLRFTSPHPKDFPDDLLEVIAKTPNIAKQIHLPAQSGSNRVLAAMRRGYSREAYLTLAARIRQLVPGVSISSDFIAGFCGEREEDHADTLSLMDAVRFEAAYMFAYSRRERTHAAYKLTDDVPAEVKAQRLQDVIAAFRRGAREAHAADEGRVHLVLLEGHSRKSTPEQPLLAGRTDDGKRCVVAADARATAGLARSLAAAASGSSQPNDAAPIRPGDFVAVEVVGSGATSLIGKPVAVTDIAEWHAVVGNAPVSWSELLLRASSLRAPLVHAAAGSRNASQILQ